MIYFADEADTVQDEIWDAHRRIVPPFDLEPAVADTHDLYCILRNLFTSCKGIIIAVVVASLAFSPN